MVSPQSNRRKVDKPFAPLVFVLTVIITLAVMLASLRLLAPSMWSVYVQASWSNRLLTFLATYMVCGGVEFLFHRYCFHTHPIRFLKHLYDQHVLHHGLTNVKLIKSSGKVFSRYEIVEDKQHEASYFPWYALAVFTLLGLVFIFIPAQIVLPSSPIVFCGILSVALAMILYELLHALEHLSYVTYWKPKIEHPQWSGFWKVVYCFHLRHHADVLCNEAVGGFFGLPVFDWICRTYKSSRLVLLDGMPAIEQDFESPRPIWPIRLLDRWAAWSMRRQKLVYG